MTHLAELSSSIPEPLGGTHTHTHVINLLTHAHKAATDASTRPGTTSLTAQGGGATHTRRGHAYTYTPRHPSRQQVPHSTTFKCPALTQANYCTLHTKPQKQQPLSKDGGDSCRQHPCKTLEVFMLFSLARGRQPCACTCQRPGKAPPPGQMLSQACGPLPANTLARLHPQPCLFSLPRVRQPCACSTVCC